MGVFNKDNKDHRTGCIQLPDQVQVRKRERSCGHFF